MEPVKDYCLKFKDLRTNHTWYGRRNYTRAKAEETSHKMNAQYVDTEVSMALVSERDRVQKEDNSAR